MLSTSLNVPKVSWREKLNFEGCWHPAFNNCQEEKKKKGSLQGTSLYKSLLRQTLMEKKYWMRLCKMTIKEDRVSQVTALGIPWLVLTLYCKVPQGNLSMFCKHFHFILKMLSTPHTTLGLKERDLYFNTRESGAKWEEPHLRGALKKKKI